VGPAIAPELLTLADDEAIVWRGPEAKRYTGLRPDAPVDLDGHEVHTLPRRGELLCRLATVNDVHFGEREAGRMGDADDFEVFSVPEGAEPYPELMSRSAAVDIARIEPALVLAKGDLTADGTEEQFRRFEDTWHGAFGDRLMAVRGNHESYHGLHRADAPFQEAVLAGVHVALLDTSRDGHANGDLTAEQIDWLDELGARADRPVLVFGHHPVWNHAEEPRSERTFGLLPDATDALVDVFTRRRHLRGWFAGHTHRNRVVEMPTLPGVPFAEVACVKDYPGSWAEYRVFEGCILQVHRRISDPAAVAWTELTRGMFGGAYPAYARGRLTDRCFVVWRDDVHPPAE
jgi:predicted phosphodiesterase